QPAGDLTRPLAKLIAGDGSIAGAKDDVAARLEQRLRQRAEAQPPAEHLDALGHAAKNDRSARAGHGGRAALPPPDRAERDEREQERDEDRGERTSKCERRRGGV